MDKLKNWRTWFRTRPAPESTSPFGLSVQLVGASSVLVGLYLIYPPLAFLVGGLAAILIGEKV